MAVACFEVVHFMFISFLWFRSSKTGHHLFWLDMYQNFTKFVDIKYTKRSTDLRTVGILMSPNGQDYKRVFCTKSSLHL